VSQAKKPAGGIVLPRPGARPPHHHVERTVTKLNRTQREILKAFKTPTVEKRDPTPKTVSNAISNGLLDIVAYDEQNFMILKLTCKGELAIKEEA
jgi:hypothetical protein